MLNKTNKYQTLLAVCLLTLSACSTNETLTDSPIDQSKTPIELTVGIVGENTSTPRALTRTVTTDSPYGNAASAFSSATSLYMVMKSEHATDNTKVPKYTRTIGTVPGSAAESPLNVSFASGYERYWEDSYSRDSKVSVYSACIPGSNTALNIGSSTNYNNGTYTWSTDAITPNINIAWPLVGTSSSASQDADFLTAQDLCFSNNVSSLPNPDNRIAFDGTLNKFTSKRLIFHHALTKVTFKIKKGDGFGTDPFAFANPTSENIILKGFNSSGTLDISSGDFSSVGTADISFLADTHTDADVTAGYSHVLTCLMLPGSALTSTATNEVYFTIDNNKYHIKKSDLATALSGKTVGTNSTTALTDSKMRPGVHYIFTLTVSKKGIDKLSASVVDWETATADEITPTNARFDITLPESGSITGADAGFVLYRAANTSTEISDTYTSYDWATGYVGNKATLTENSTAGVYTAIGEGGTTPWYWPDNMTFYHFRAVKPENHAVTHDNTDNYDYITLTGAIAPFTDVCWGAPFNTTTGTLTYSTTYGFDNTSGDTHQISKAIGPTSETITLQIFHMMSDVTIRLTTTTDANLVDLTGATVKLTPLYSAGRVRMGDGLILTTGSAGDVTGTVVDIDGQSYKQWKYGFVPQSLTGVVLTITTTDNNQYKVTMHDKKATITNSTITNPYTSAGSGKYTINAWYPNFQYTYTFKLTKTGVESISATIANWGTVTANQETVVIQ